jgi:hypothetical protein
VSITDVTIRMAWIAGLAVVALAMAGWRKTARAQPKTPRSAMQTPRRIPYEVHVAPAPLYRPAGVLRRLWAVIASTGLTLIIGAIIATIAGFSIAFIVTTMTDLLKQ